MKFAVAFVDVAKNVETGLNSFEFVGQVAAAEWHDAFATKVEDSPRGGVGDEDVDVAGDGLPFGEQLFGIKMIGKAGEVWNPRGTVDGEAFPFEQLVLEDRDLVESEFLAVEEEVVVPSDRDTLLGREFGKPVVGVG